MEYGELHQCFADYYPVKEQPYRVFIYSHVLYADNNGGCWGQRWGSAYSNWCDFIRLDNDRQGGDYGNYGHGLTFRNKFKPDNFLVTDKDGTQVTVPLTY